MNKPYFVDGNFSWYIDEKHTNYLKEKQAENLPPIENLGVFRVVNEMEGIDDYVLINNRQQAIKSYNYGPNGAEQLVAYINFLKIEKHFTKHENNLELKKTRRSYEKF